MAPRSSPSKAQAKTTSKTNKGKVKITVPAKPKAPRKTKTQIQKPQLSINSELGAEAEKKRSFGRYFREIYKNVIYRDQNGEEIKSTPDEDNKYNNLIKMKNNEMKALGPKPEDEKLKSDYNKQVASLDAKYTSLIKKLPYYSLTITRDGSIGHRAIQILDGAMRDILFNACQSINKKLTFEKSNSCNAKTVITAMCGSYKPSVARHIMIKCEKAISTLAKKKRKETQ